VELFFNPGHHTGVKHEIYQSTTEQKERKEKKRKEKKRKEKKKFTGVTYKRHLLQQKDISNNNLQ
jgi:hypothetical protein